MKKATLMIGALVLANIWAGTALAAASPTNTPAAALPPNAFAGVMSEMHHAMDIPSTGNVDEDFVRGMIPHHEGAIAMAKILLERSQNPELRQLATEIVAAQTKEIAWMQAWLAKHAAPPVPTTGTPPADPHAHH